MKSGKRIKYFSSISQGQNHIPPHRFQSVDYCLTPLDPLANYFYVFVLPGEVPGCIPSKISYPFFSIRKSEDFLFFCCRILNFLSIFLIFCCILELGQFFNCFTCKQNYHHVFSQDSTLHCQNFSILFRKKLSKDTRHVHPPLSWQRKSKKKGRGIKMMKKLKMMLVLKIFRIFLTCFLTGFV